MYTASLGITWTCSDFQLILLLCGKICRFNQDIFLNRKTLLLCNSRLLFLYVLSIFGKIIVEKQKPLEPLFHFYFYGVSVLCLFVLLTFLKCAPQLNTLFLDEIWDQTYRGFSGYFFFLYSWWLQSFVFVWFVLFISFAMGWFLFCLWFLRKKSILF